MNTPVVRYLLLLLAISTIATCASASSDSGPGRDPNRITHAEIQAATDAQNAYDLVQQLRPRWLRSRGGRSLTMETNILVYVDRSRLGGLEGLRQIQPEGIYELEYLDAARATALLPGIGSQHVEGAIVIHTQARGAGRQ